MRFDRFTIKAQDALETAQSLAKDAQSPELGVEHLMPGSHQAIGWNRHPDSSEVGSRSCENYLSH